MHQTGSPEDWAKAVVLFLLSLALVVDAMHFVWGRLPEPAQEACKRAGGWLVLGRVTCYLLVTLLLALVLALGIALAWKETGQLESRPVPHVAPPEVAPSHNVFAGDGQVNPASGQLSAPPSFARMVEERCGRSRRRSQAGPAAARDQVRS